VTRHSSADEHVVIEQGVDLTDEGRLQVALENVPCRNEQILSQFVSSVRFGQYMGLTLLIATASDGQSFIKRTTTSGRMPVYGTKEVGTRIM
jgi:hypothetical protein